MRQEKELNKLYDQKGNMIPAEIVAFVKVNNKDVVVYKYINSDELLASFYTIDNLEQKLNFEPITSEADWLELEKKLDTN